MPWAKAHWRGSPALSASMEGNLRFGRGAAARMQDGADTDVLYSWHYHSSLHREKRNGISSIAFDTASFPLAA